jgi:hypothetical protein
MNNDQAGKSGLIAPKVTEGEWDFDHRKNQPPQQIDDPGYYEIIGGPIVRDQVGPIADTGNRHHCISPEEDRANAKMLAASKKLAEALNGLLEIHPLPGESVLATYERIGDCFQRDTGLLRPGKDDRSGTTCEDREKAFDEWLDNKPVAARAALLSAGYTHSEEQP